MDILGSVAFLYLNYEQPVLRVGNGNLKDRIAAHAQDKIFENGDLSLSLHQRSVLNVIAEYIWIGESGKLDLLDLRSKARRLFQGRHYVVVPRTSQCGTMMARAQPKLSTVNYVIEQDYTLLQKDDKWPLGWPLGRPGPSIADYCSAGADKSFGRDIADAHYKACIYAGIVISGINRGVMPGQWKFQVGPVVGISAGDQLWVARYILERITEIAGVGLSFDPKPIQGCRSGAGSHTYYRTKSMSDGGKRQIEIIEEAIEKLRLRHKQHISAFDKCLTEWHETAADNSSDVVNPWACVRVDHVTEHSGYFEDTESDMDPYTFTSMIAETTILYKPT